MHHNVADRVWEILRCPLCGANLRPLPDGAACAPCDAHFGYDATGALDLRLPRAKSVEQTFTIGPGGPPLPGPDLGPLPFHPAPQVDFSQVRLPPHLSREMLSHFPKAKSSNSLMLDLGCGDAVHRGVSEHAGFHYVGLDYGWRGAPLFGDAHALPFADESFEFILCLAVLEHIRLPFVMTREAARVLQPGGLLLGTVAFLEPFHQNSFYHHTHLGTANSLQEAGLTVEHVCPGAHWSVLRAQATMALFPAMPTRLATALVAPLHGLHRLWWKVGALVSRRALERQRVTATTGAFTFIARKPVR